MKFNVTDIINWEDELFCPHCHCGQADGVPAKNWFPNANCGQTTMVHSCINCGVYITLELDKDRVKVAYDVAAPREGKPVEVEVIDRDTLVLLGETCQMIGTIGNTQGSLSVGQHGGRFYWYISNFGFEDQWEEIPESLYMELVKFEAVREK